MVKLFLKNSNLCDHNSPTSQTDGRTDGQTTCDRNTALCTKVHRAVIIIATETLGVCNASARHLLGDLGRRISENSGEARKTSLASCTKGFRYWCSASMLSFCMTVCRLQTAQTDDRTQFCIYFSIFKLPHEYVPMV